MVPVLKTSGPSAQLSVSASTCEDQPAELGVLPGAFAKRVADGLKLRHDHGSQYLSDPFQAELKFLGIASSPAFVREPEGNGCVERFFRTLKENLLWVRTFRTVEELRLALIEFRRTYNQQWILQRLGYRAPAQARLAWRRGQQEDSN